MQKGGVKMVGIKEMSKPGCYPSDFKEHVKSIFPGVKCIDEALENGDENVGFSLREELSLGGVFVRQCLDDPERREELEAAVNRAVMAQKLLDEWMKKYRPIFWED